MMERVALSAGRCGSECVEYSLTKNKGMSLMLTGLLFVFMYTYLHIETLWTYTSLFFIGAICIQFISCLYLERLDLG